MNSQKSVRPFSVVKARKAQLTLSKQIIRENMLPEKIRYVAGIDVAYTGGSSVGAVAVLEYDTLNLMESKTAICKIPLPYVPTLLSFREVPPSILCIKKLQVEPDVFLVDGHGLAHPYRCGFASHLGVVLKKPTIGVAKSKLVGEIEENAGHSVKYIKHNGEVVGAAVTTVPGVKPVYVSVGNMISLEAAIKIVMHCVRGSRIPVPLREAHRIATHAKRQIENVKTHY
ncbi:endonuclease V [Candidatus Bathyarchaeota archaeon]|nr:endonuclease V [Candidatus Bathyarchaeota archaeon]